MMKIRYALCAAIPLVWGAMAMAADPAGTEPAGARPAAAKHHQHDMAAWHKEMCTDHYAHAASHLAYLQAKLSLSEDQSALFGKWRQVVLEQSAKERDACLGMTPPKGDAKPTLLDREAHLEQVLTLKLQGLQAARPSLEALYNSLSDAQKATFDHAAHEHFHHHGWFGGPDGHEGGHGGGHMGMDMHKD